MKIAGHTPPSIAEDLRMLGYDVAVGERGLKIRLPLMCRVTVAFHEEAIRLLPEFGLFSRTAATWVTSLMVVVLLIVVYRAEAGTLTQLGFGIVLLAIGALVWDVYRYVVTESAIMTVRYLLIARLSNRDDR